MNFLAVIFPLIGFALQYYPRLFNNYFGIDVWTRLLETDAVRQNNHKIPDKIERGFIITGEFDYPPVFPWVLSWFPKRWIERYQGIVSPFFDALTNLAIYFIVMQTIGDVRVALAAQFVYTFIPMIVLENSSLTPRSLGYFLFTVAFYLQIVVYQWGGITEQPVVFLAALLVSLLVFLSHRFAAQSLFFIDIAATLALQSAIFLTIFLVAFALAFVVTRGYYLRVLRGHLFNIYFWIVNQEYRYWHQVKGNISAKRNPDFVGKIYYFLNKFAPFALFGVNFWIASAVGFVLAQATGFNLGVIVANNWIFLFSWWVIFFYLLAALVLSSKYLVCIGEGQRYLEMAAAPSAIIAGYLFVAFLGTPYAMLVIIVFVALNLGNLAMILLVQRTGVVKDRNRSLTPEMRKLFAAVNKLPGKPRILSIPHYMTTMLIYFTKADVLVNADNPGVMRINDIWPLITEPISAIVARHSITHVVIKESFASTKELKGFNGKEIFRADDIVVYAMQTKAAK